MSDVLDALAGTVTPPARCKAGRWLDDLTAPEVDALAASVRSRSVNGTLLALVAGGVAPCGESAWARHWSQLCRCTPTPHLGDPNA